VMDAKYIQLWELDTNVHVVKTLISVLNVSRRVNMNIRLLRLEILHRLMILCMLTNSNTWLKSRRRVVLVLYKIFKSLFQ
jgi:hypothetical protein